MTDQTPQRISPAAIKPEFKNRLAYTMALALLLFAMLPVSIMALAGYWQARSLIQEQTALQIHSVAHSKTDVFDQLLGAKETRMNRLSHRAAFLGAAENLMEASSTLYEEELNEEFNTVNHSGERSLFDYIFIVDNEGVTYASPDNG